MEPRAVKSSAVYCRISQDRDGTMLGVERQERLCRELAERKGWSIAETYVDNDLGAYSGKPRPAYRRMLTDLANGTRDAVLCVDLDRLTRQPAELETFIALADKHGIALANVSGDTDLSTSDGRFRARILGAVARQESEKKSERIKRQREQAATKGLPHPGPRAFGYEPDGMRIRAAEAKAVQSGAATILAGRSVRSVADEWNAAGITTARGNAWTVNAVRDLLTSPRIAGMRRHKGEIVGDGAWPAILERDTWERLRAVANGRKRSAGRPPTRLLSGVCSCGLCGGAMRSSTSKGTSLYACRRQPGKSNGGSCGRLSVKADAVDAEVRDQLLAVLASDRLAEALDSHRQDEAYREVTTRLQADEQALEELSQDFYVHRLLGRGEFLRAHKELERRITTARRQLETSGPTGILPTVGRDEQALREWWDAAPGDVRRTLVETVIDRVVIDRLDAKRQRRFHPDRVRIEWRV